MNSARLAYDLDSYEGLGYSADCDIGEMDSLVLVVDYQRAYLEVSLAYATDPINMIEESYRYDGFGGQGESSPTSSELSTLEAKVKEMLAKQMKKNRPLKSNFNDVRAVVFSGEATKDGFEKVKHTLEGALPGLKNRFRFSLDPFWVGAIGATQRGRHVALNPKSLQPPDCHYVDEDGYQKEL
ncbi:uncharacterized protein PAC_08619 [Phialocephala subalpina]|uniref:Uncharacterized protein n=1 Tax=Phialocephala subalpina TaxID=576137 RepID=A0A1L7X129_9HELO|nr:uncharacterized protein PAC_08619 [Phialocephala subalpina]